MYSHENTYANVSTHMRVCVCVSSPVLLTFHEFCYFVIILCYSSPIFRISLVNSLRFINATYSELFLICLLLVYSFNSAFYPFLLYRFDDGLRLHRAYSEFSHRSLAYAFHKAHKAQSVFKHFAQLMHMAHLRFNFFPQLYAPKKYSVAKQSAQ